MISTRWIGAFGVVLLAACTAAGPRVPYQPMYQAAIRGDVEEMARLVASGEKLLPGEILSAAQFGQIRTAEYMIEVHKVSPNFAFGYGRLTALMTAVEYGQTAFVQYLLSKGADPNQPGRDGGADGPTALFYLTAKSNSRARETPEAFREYQERLWKTVEVLLAAGARTDVTRPGGTTLLWKYVINGLDLIVDRLVTGGHADINIRNHGGTTPIYAAKPAQIAFLVKLGARIDVQDQDGNTPLHVAIDRCATPDRIAAWLSHGVQVNHRNKAGRTALGELEHRVTVKGPLDRGFDCTQRDRPTYSEVRKILLAAGAVQ